jgi:putative transposase
MESNSEPFASTAFERLFKERGLPRANPLRQWRPFGSPNGLFNLSRLSVWWLRLGLSIERIKPGHPQQNGRTRRLPMNCPAEVYTASTKPYRGIAEPQCPFRRHQLRPSVLVSQKHQFKHLPGRSGGRHQGSRLRHLARQLYGIRSLGRSGRENFAAPQQQPNPFGPKVLPMSYEQSVYHVSRPDLDGLASPRGFEPLLSP